MPEAYSKPCQISRMMKHIENPGIIRTVYSGIFRHIQWHSAILSHFQTYWGTLRHVEAHSGIIEAIFRILCNPYIYKCGILKTLTHLEPKASAKACWTCKMTRHIQSPGIVRTLCKHFQGYLGIFRDIDAYSSTLTGMQLRGRCQVSQVKFSIQNVVV